jgi:hypothetical protein
MERLGLRVICSPVAMFEVHIAIIEITSTYAHQIPQSWFILEKLIVAQVVKKFPVFYGAWSFVTMLNKDSLYYILS